MPMLKVAILLPVPLFLQILNLLHLLKIFTEAHDFDYSALLEFLFGEQRNRSELFVLWPPQYQESRASFLFRTQRIVNKLPKDIDFLDQPGLRN